LELDQEETENNFGRSAGILCVSFRNRKIFGGVGENMKLCFKYFMFFPLRFCLALDTTSKWSMRKGREKAKARCTSCQTIYFRDFHILRWEEEAASGGSVCDV
jgi:hypothetical protein